MFHKEGTKIIFFTLAIVVLLSLVVNHFVGNSLVRGGLILTLVVFLILILHPTSKSLDGKVSLFLECIKEMICIFSHQCH
jgi:hypothetical protein